MFPPVTPTTERIRIENELSELQRRAARQANMGPSRLNFQIHWSFLGRIGQWTSAVTAAFTRPAPRPIRATQTQPPACDC